MGQILNADLTPNFNSLGNPFLISNIQLLAPICRDLIDISTELIYMSKSDRIVFDLRLTFHRWLSFA